MVKGLVGHGSALSLPILSGNRLHGGEDPVVDILLADPIAAVVIPDGEHTPLDLWVMLLEGLTSHCCRSPLLVQLLDIEVVIVVPRRRDDVDPSVRDADDVVPEVDHLLPLGVVIAPAIEQNVVYFHRCLTPGVGERAPDGCFLPQVLHLADVAIRESPKLLHHHRVSVAVLIRPDMDVRGDKGGVCRV